MRAATHYVPQTYSYTTYRPEVRTRVIFRDTDRTVISRHAETHRVVVKPLPPGIQKQLVWVPLRLPLGGPVGGFCARPWPALGPLPRSRH